MIILLFAKNINHARDYCQQELYFDRLKIDECIDLKGNSIKFISNWEASKGYDINTPVIYHHSTNRRKDNPSLIGLVYTRFRNIEVDYHNFSFT